VILLRPSLLRFNHAADALRNESNDRVDDPLLVGIASASMFVPVVVTMPVLAMVTIPVASAASIVSLTAAIIFA
jgi:hypothetical protein